MLKIRQLIFVVKLHNQEQIDCSQGFRGVNAISRKFHTISSHSSTFTHWDKTKIQCNRCVRRNVNHQAKILKAMGAFNQVNAFSEYCENFANFRWQLFCSCCLLQWCRGAVPPRVILEINRNLDLDFTFIETAQPGAAAAGLAARWYVTNAGLQSGCNDYPKCHMWEIQHCRGPGQGSRAITHRLRRSYWGPPCRPPPPRPAAPAPCCRAASAQLWKSTSDSHWSGAQEIIIWMISDIIWMIEIDECLS